MLFSVTTSVALARSLGDSSADLRQAKVCNIGAEGQYLVGALGGAGVALFTPSAHGVWIVALMTALGAPVDNARCACTARTAGLRHLGARCGKGMSTYEIGLIGDITPMECDVLTATIAALVAEFDLKIGRDIMIRTGSALESRETHAATAIAYFGGHSQADRELAQQLVKASLPIIPTIEASGDFRASVPYFLQSANGLRRGRDDPKMSELAVALLECVGLLRRQRRVFVSYRRIESRTAAVQLHDLLSSRGFDVFLDTHDLRPGEPFQDVLWHRLCDSDVMVMLDTPAYFNSKWTRQELGRARAKEIHVLRVVWPEHTPPAETNFAETIYLKRSELKGSAGPIVKSIANQIVLATENLRSRSIAFRYLSITGKIRAEVTKIGGTVEGIGAYRAIALSFPRDLKIWAYPIVGVPTADLFNDVADKASRSAAGEIPILVYDHVGLRDTWKAHLKWLDDNIRSVRAIPISELAWTLVDWETAA